MKATRTKRGTTGGWAGDMKLKKLKAARAKWLENQQAQQRPEWDLQLIAIPLARHRQAVTVKVKTKEGWMPRNEDEYDPKKCMCGSGLEKGEEYDAITRLARRPDRGATCKMESGKGAVRGFAPSDRAAPFSRRRF